MTPATVNGIFGGRCVSGAPAGGCVVRQAGVVRRFRVVRRAHDVPRRGEAAGDRVYGRCRPLHARTSLRGIVQLESGIVLGSRGGRGQDAGKGQRSAESAIARVLGHNTLTFASARTC